jgi:hypothetical protein
MISFDQARKAFDRARIVCSDLQLSNFLNDLLPNPQAGFSVGGANLWGDSFSINRVKSWHHAHEITEQWRSQVDANQQRAMRAEELGIRCLDFALRVSAMNPASAENAPGLAVSLLTAHNIEPREGFFLDDGDSQADARTKFYAAAHPSPRPRG